MKKLLGVLSAVLFVSVASTAMAEDARRTQQRPAPQRVTVSNPLPTGFDGYGMAGCGLGSMLFKGRSNDGMIQILAATTNGTSGNQTFGITFGTSNCNPGHGPARTASLFIIANREALEKDVSRGSGESLEHLAKIVGCQQDALGAHLQTNYGTIFPTQEVSNEDVAKNVMTTIQSNPAMAQSCKSMS